jgi:hypothetical protein
VWRCAHTCARQPTRSAVEASLTRAPVLGRLFAQLFDVSAGEAAAVALTLDASALLELAGVQHNSHLTFKLAPAAAAAPRGVPAQQSTTKGVLRLLVACAFGVLAALLCHILFGVSTYAQVLDAGVAKCADALLSLLGGAAVAVASWLIGGISAELKRTHNQLCGKVNNVERKVESVDCKVESVERKVDNVDEKLDAVKTTTDRLYGALVLRVQDAP